MRCLHEANMSQRELSRVSGVSVAEVSRVVNGHRKQPTQAILDALARSLHVPVEEMYRHAGLRLLQVEAVTHDERSVVHAAADVVSSPYFPVPVLSAVRVLPGGTTREDIIGYHFEAVSLMQGNPSEYAYLKVSGEAMIDERIVPGSLVLIRRQRSVKDGDLALVVVNGAEEAVLRRYVTQPNGQVILMAANAAAGLLPEVHAADEVRVIGKAIQLTIKFE